MPQNDDIKTIGLVAGYIISVVSLALLAVIAGDGTRTTVVSLLSTIAIASAATLGVMHVGGLTVDAIKARGTNEVQKTEIVTKGPAANGSDSAEPNNSVNNSGAL